MDEIARYRSTRCPDNRHMYRLFILQLTSFTILLNTRVSHGGANERRLLENLFNEREYNKLERPVANESDALQVTFGLILQQIIEVDEKNQIIQTNIWLRIAWNDSNMSWNETDFGGISSVRVPPSMIWKPDILMYNSADEDIDSTFPTNVVVQSTGSCLWVPPGLFLSTCKIDIQWFPFDDQRCKMKFGSWTYHSADIDLRLESEAGDVSSFISNGEWQLIGVDANRSVTKYDCCPEEYIDVTFTIHIRRRTLYYGFNLIIPCVLISSMTLLTFTLPPDAGEKISLGVTVLLSLTVFLLLVAETMPPTSDAVPLIGMYFSAIMLMCSLSVVCTVLVLNFHHRSPDTYVMPYWVKRVICETLARILRMKRPAGCGSSLRQTPGTLSKKQAVRAKIKELQFHARSSRSLLANVLDLDDLYLLRSNFNHAHFPPPLLTAGADAHSKAEQISNKVFHSDLSASGFSRIENASNCVSTANLQSLQNTNCTEKAHSKHTHTRNSSHCSGAPKPPWFESANCSGNGTNRKRERGSSDVTGMLLQEILLHVRQVTRKFKKDEERQDLCSDWKFAAMVIDRLCLWLFTIFTVVSTFAILFSSPHVLVA